MKVLDYIRDCVRVVLVEPTHPGNIGATARAMANMGLRRLTLVRPREFPSPIATSRAAGADWLLAEAEVCETLQQAIADCVLAFGTTARQRALRWPQLEPQQAAEKLVQSAAAGPVALVFGRESRGLTNAELARCQYQVSIPVDADFPSLNLGAAVAVLLYEVRKSALAEVGEVPPMAAEARASAQDSEGFYQHLEQVLQAIEFTDGSNPNLMRKLRRLYHRAQLSREEVNILRGILSSVQRQLGRR